MKANNCGQISIYSSSSSSCHAASTDLPDPLSPPISIVHHSREVFMATFCIGTELFCIGSNWFYLSLIVHVNGSTGLYRLWVCLYFPRCTACLVRLIWRVFVMGGRWPYSCCFDSRTCSILLAAFLYNCPVAWGCRIHRLCLCRGVRPPQWVSWIWHSKIWWAPLHCHCFQVHSGPEWSHLIGPYLWVK